MISIQRVAVIRSFRWFHMDQSEMYTPKVKPVIKGSPEGLEVDCVLHRHMKPEEM